MKTNNVICLSLRRFNIKANICNEVCCGVRNNINLNICEKVYSENTRKNATKKKNKQKRSRIVPYFNSIEANRFLCCYFNGNRMILFNSKKKMIEMESGAFGLFAIQ